MHYQKLSIILKNQVFQKFRKVQIIFDFEFKQFLVTHVKVSESPIKTFLVIFCKNILPVDPCSENSTSKQHYVASYQNFGSLGETIEATKMQSCVSIYVSCFHFRSTSLDQKVNQEGSLFRRIYVGVHTSRVQGIGIILKRIKKFQKTPIWIDQEVNQEGSFFWRIYVGILTSRVQGIGIILKIRF